MSVRRTQEKYLGDGIYASFDGYQMWLAVNNHENVQAAIEPRVFEAMLRYAGETWDSEKVAEMLRKVAEELDPHHY